MPQCGINRECTTIFYTNKQLQLASYPLINLLYSHNANYSYIASGNNRRSCAVATYSNCFEIVSTVAFLVSQAGLI